MSALIAAKYRAEIATLEAQLAEAKERAEWRPITPDSLPKVGDEVLRISDNGIVWVYSAVKNYKSFDEAIALMDTHYRPINPPEPLP